MALSSTLAIGVSGMALILFAFLMNQFHKWKSTSIAYDVFNFIGGGLLVAYAYLINSWPFLVLNLVWTGVSIWEIFLDLKPAKKRSHKHKAYVGHKRR